jgi:hypothetical protein
VQRLLLAAIPLANLTAAREKCASRLTGHATGATTVADGRTNPSPAAKTSATRITAAANRSEKTGSV